MQLIRQDGHIEAILGVTNEAFLAGFREQITAQYGRSKLVPMGRQALLSEIPGNTFYGGPSRIYYFSQDGRLFDPDKETNKVHKGSWTVSDNDKMCLSIRGISGCTTFYQDGNNFGSKLQNNCAWRHFRRVEGNPENYL